MKAARLSITWELLIALLNLPERTDIKEVEVKISPPPDGKWREGHRTLELLLFHPDLKEVPKGEPIPYVTPEWNGLGVLLSWGQSGLSEQMTDKVVS
jgi:hypothetical protein